MRTKLFLFLTVFSTLCYAQTMHKGIYYNIKKDIGFVSEVFEFKEGRTFDYFMFGCTGVSYGAGTYTLVGDSLSMVFKDLPKPVPNGLQLLQTDSDSLSINIKVIEFYDGEGLPGANCVFKENKKGWSTDFYGNVKATTQKLDSVMTLQIQYLGYGTTEITIPPNTTKIKGVVNMSGVYFYDSTDTLRLRVRSKWKNRFTLAGYEDYDITYRKIKEKKIADKLKFWTDKPYRYFTGGMKN